MRRDSIVPLLSPVRNNTPGGVQRAGGLRLRRGIEPWLTRDVTKS